MGQKRNQVFYRSATPRVATQQRNKMNAKYTPYMPIKDCWNITVIRALTKEAGLDPRYVINVTNSGDLILGEWKVERGTDAAGIYELCLRLVHLPVPANPNITIAHSSDSPATRLTTALIERFQTHARLVWFYTKKPNGDIFMHAEIYYTDTKEHGNGLRGFCINWDDLAFHFFRKELSRLLSANIDPNSDQMKLLIMLVSKANEVWKEKKEKLFESFLKGKIQPQGAINSLYSLSRYKNYIKN